MKAIILAAGKGTRLGKYTQDLPKGMLNFNGKTLIERQVKTLMESGIRDIIIVTGYMADKIKIKGVGYYHNPDYENTNMVATLFCAEKEMDEELIVCYSDLIYEKKIIEKVMDSDADIGVCVDEDYLDYWKKRLDNWQDDLESVQINNDGNIWEIGTKTTDLEKTKTRYVGIVKFSKKGLDILKEIFYENKNKYWNKEERWLNSKSFKKAYMTDILQAIINKGYKIKPIKIKRGWMEFDTEKDYEKAVEWAKNEKIKDYINLSLFNKKRIAISQRVITAEKGVNKDGLEQDYTNYYQKYNFILILVPNVLENIEEYLLELKIDGIILSGGNDINPKSYGKIEEENLNYSNERDLTEKKLMDFAIANKIPVLGECRGVQFINVYFGGKLARVKNHIGEHEIEIIDSRFKESLKINKTFVNSFHNFGISESDLSKELKTFAKSSDGFIEGIYHPNLPVLGIMWHPERESPDKILNERLIKKFVNFIDNG